MEKDFVQECSAEFRVTNGKKQTLEWEDTKSAGIEYEVHIQIDGREEQMIGVLSHAEKPIFEGFSFLFTKYVDDEVAKTAFISGNNVEQAVDDIFKDLMLS